MMAGKPMEGLEIETIGCSYGPAWMVINSLDSQHLLHQVPIEDFSLHFEEPLYLRAASFIPSRSPFLCRIQTIPAIRKLVLRQALTFLRFPSHERS